MPWGASRKTSLLTASNTLPSSTCGASSARTTACSTATAQPTHPLTFHSTGGATRLANWGKTSDASDFLNDAFTGNDPFNEFVGNLGNLTTLDLLITEALGYQHPTPTPPPPAATTADMILRHGADGKYEIYDLGNNTILAAFQLGQV